MLKEVNLTLNQYPLVWLYSNMYMPTARCFRTHEHGFELNVAVLAKVHAYVLMMVQYPRVHVCRNLSLKLGLQISDFRPRLTREQKDIILAEAEKSLTKIKSKLVRLIPGHNA